MKKMLLAVLVMGMVGAVGAAPVLSPLPMEGRAAMGATHELVISYSDLTASATNTAQTLTNSVPAKTAVEFVAMVLSTAFDTANTNYTGSMALKVGDGSDDDLFLTLTELASDGSEVFLKYGPLPSVTVSYTSAVLTNVPYNGATGNVTVVTGVTGAGTVGDLSRKVYTAAGSIVTTLTPNAEEALSANTAGKVTLYFKLISL